MGTRTWTRLGSLALLILTVVRTGAAEITDQQAREAIENGVRYLLDKQSKTRGDWSEHYSQTVLGTSALATLALLNAGVDPKSDSIQNALTYLRSMPMPESTYGISLQTMAFCAADPKRFRAEITRNVQWLEKSQMRAGPRVGSWSYGGGRGTGGDNSNAQFAVLALHEAERVGVKVDPQTWKASLDYWVKCQNQDGSWSYLGSDAGTGSMTCAGITSVIICSGRVGDGDAKVNGETIECCGEQANNESVERGIQWLADHFHIDKNPNAPLGGYWLYYLYGLERVGRMSGRRFIGQHDWFREGAEILISMQDDLRGQWNGRGHAEGEYPVIATSLALLFLSKGRRPVVMSKLQHTDTQDWDRHRTGTQNLTFHVEQRWRRDLTWQSIDVRAATVDDLAQSPVLFISGRDGLKFTAEHEENLREYVQRGGFIFAEAACGGPAFDRDFRELMKRLFPDSELRLLPADHPVWFAEQKVDPNHLKPLYGIDACCRTSVVYCPQDLSCLWELSRGNRETAYPVAVRNEIDACLRIGTNVLTYATNRELRNKLDQHPGTTNLANTETLERGTLYVPKLRHSGGSDDAPNALPNLLGFVRQQAQIRSVVENRLVSPTDESLLEYPIAFLHGRRQFRFSPADRKALSTYVERGGVIFADAICASPEFTESFRREISAIFPGKNLERIPPDHSIFTKSFRGYDLPKVTLRDPQIRSGDDPLRANLTQISPVLEGITVGDRIAVIFSPFDLSCALENGASLQCKGYIKEDAARLGTNVILFALLQ